MADAGALGNHFRGEIRDVQSAAPAGTPVEDDLDLSWMAKRALNYLRGNPDPARLYECKFALGPLGVPCHVPISPPSKDAFDVVSLGDTDVRMDGQYLHMRRMAGEASACEVERGVRSRVLSYLRDDGYSWVNPGAAIGETIEGEWVMSWTTAKTLFNLSETYAADGGERTKKLCRRIFEALKRLALWDGPRAYIPGIAPYKDGEWLRRGWCVTHARSYSIVVEPLVRYWQVTGDEEALSLAKAFAEGYLAGSQKDQAEMAIDPATGRFENHVHMHTHAMWGVADLGAIIGEPRYLNWVDAPYRFVVSQGSDFGWYPEFVPQGEWRTEICVVGDMVANGAHLARGGRPEYWDHVERTIRNQIRRSQFFLTPEFLALFARLHADKGTAVVDGALAELRKLEGGFVAQSTFNDWVGYPENIGQAGLYLNGIHMMGCCPPEGMHALWEAYLGVVEEKQGTVWINMNLHRDHEAAKVVAYRPECGRMEVHAKRAGKYMLRPPAWAERGGTELRIADCGMRIERRIRMVSTGPAGSYVQVADVKSGDVLTLSWPVPKFTQDFHPSSVPGKTGTITVQWCGNEVLDMTPAAKYLPMYGKKP